ncbi:N-acetylneuraminate synthase family protein [Arsenicibacter rosenii]|uniref:PseI/NeuA/B-like domain-containing protein n=1 Tax=Arsenicibacter rosenii TaxID=1750698 RepID=A0A1S2VK78_9BACT|nr:N-acetylneuraminate synthase family protein [Arsenicibacter rosenii]OIN58800.1 hypothetical protein BLX24_11225 [Arsenicibacter rosenii]
MENFLSQIRNIVLKSHKNKLLIVGKGESSRELVDYDLKDFFVININDSERIIQGDISLFYKIDFFESIKSNNFSSEKYIAPSYLKIPDQKHIEVSYEAWRQDSHEHILDYLRSETYYLTDYVILSAIKFSLEYQKILKENIEVFFVGFDFYASTLSPEDNVMHDLKYKNAFLKTQESQFKEVIEYFNMYYKTVKLKHVGEKEFSEISIQGFKKFLDDINYDYPVRRRVTNSSLYKKLTKQVERDNKVIVVAEFTNNHIGDPKRLVKMIQIAKESGADMIKVQKRDVRTFYTAEELSRPYKSPFGKTLGDYRLGVELNDDLFSLLEAECIKYEIPWFASILDWNSYEYMTKFDTVLLKLPSTISNHKNYLLKVGESFVGDLVISTGFTDKSYENFVLDNFISDRKLFLLQCTSSYPTPPEACQVAVVRHYEELRGLGYKNLYSGYSSHDVGSLGCMLAVAAGAKMIEKHVKLGDLDWVHFDGVAVDLYKNEFKSFVQDVRKAEIMCGSKSKNIHGVEHHKYTPNVTHN